MYYMFFIYLFMNYLLIEIHKLRIQVLLKNVATKYLLQSSSILLFVHFVFVYVICVFKVNKKGGNYVSRPSVTF
jgi:hypothetical protein